MILTTLKDVAKLARVDPSIVSRVINHDPGLNIKAETRARILKAVDELNYRPNMMARSLKKGETKILGMAIPSFFNPVISSIIHGAELRAAKEGYTLLVYSEEQDQSKIISSLKNGYIDGLIISSSHFDDENILELQNKELPFVLVNRKVANINNFVAADDIQGAKLGVQYLIKFGHKYIAHISGPLYTTTGLERLQGYRIALNDSNIEFNSRYVQESDYSIEGGYNAMKHLLELTMPPTAVFVANILSALGALKAIRECGLLVPDNISLVAYHDVYFADTLFSPLTTVKIPVEEMGNKAIEKLIAILHKRDNGEGIIIKGGTIIERESVARL